MNIFPSGSNNQTEYNSKTECNFRVNIDKRNVKVYKRTKEKKGILDSIFGSKKIPRDKMTVKNTNYNILVLEIKNAREVFLSDDIIQGDNGNHVLINSKNKEYISVGDDIFSFNTKDEIQFLESPVVKSGEFKLTYATGKTNTYFLSLNKNRNKIFYISNVYLKKIGFLTKDGKTFNWENVKKYDPNIYQWGLDKSTEKKEIPIKMIEKRY